MARAMGKGSKTGTKGNPMKKPGNSNPSGYKSKKYGSGKH